MTYKADIGKVTDIVPNTYNLLPYTLNGYCSNGKGKIEKIKYNKMHSSVLSGQYIFSIEVYSIIQLLSS